MTTVEKLLVQIFDRKNSIIEQVKQQTELYNKHLASKLLIDGINPPSWLWSHNNSDSKELNKDAMVARLLDPYPQPLTHCSRAYGLYNNRVGTSDNGEFSDCFFMETLGNNKGVHGQDDPTVPSMYGEDKTDSALNNISEGISITSPEDHTDSRISNIYSLPDQSLARIQRSKPRQNTLELRHSAKSLAKSALNHDNINNDLRLPVFFMEQADLTDELPKSAEHCGVGESGKDKVLGESDCQHTEKGLDVYAGRITRSRSNTKVPDFGGGSIGSGFSADNCRDVSSNGGDVRARSSMLIDAGRITRSKSNANVSDFRGSSIALSCSADHCRDVSSNGANVKTWSYMSSSDSKQADSVTKFQNLAGPSNVCFQSCGGRELDGVDYNARITRSKSSSKSKSKSCASDSFKAEGSSDIAHRNDNAIMEYEDNLLVDYADTSQARINHADFLDEGCGTRLSMTESCRIQKEMSDVVPYGRITKSLSRNQENTFVDESLDQNIASQSIVVDVSIFPRSSRRSASQVKSPNEQLGSVTPSHETGSNFLATDQGMFNTAHHSEIPRLRETSRSGLRKETANEFLNALSGQRISPFNETLCTTDEHVGADLVVGIELVSCDLADQSVSSSCNDANQRRETEFLVARPSLNSFGFVSNMKTSTSSSGKKMLDDNSKMMDCSFSDPTAPLSGDTSQTSIDEGSSEKSHFLIKGKEVGMDSIDFNVQENLGTQNEKYAPTVCEHSMSGSFLDDTEACLNRGYSEVQDEVDVVQVKLDSTPDLQIPLKLHLEQKHDSLIEQHNEEGNWNVEKPDKASLVSNVPGRKTCRPSYSLDLVKKPSAESHDCLIEKMTMINLISIVHDKINHFQTEDSQNLPHIGGEVSAQHADLPVEENGLVRTGACGSPLVKDISLEKQFRSSSIESWPQLKKRKNEQQQTTSYTISPNLRMINFHSLQIGPASRSLNNTDIDVNSVLMDAFEVAKRTDSQMKQQTDFNLTVLDSIFESQNAEVLFSCKEQNNLENSSTVFSDKPLVIAPVLTPSNKKARESDGHFIEGMRTSHSSNDSIDESNPDGRQCSHHSSSLNKDIDIINFESTLTNKLLQETNSSEWGDDRQLRCTTLSPSNKDLKSIDVDQSIPVSERYSIDAQAESNEMDFVVEGIDIDKLNLPRAMLERASILAKICRSASMSTPLSDLSPAFEFQGTQNIFQSVPNGLIESLDIRSTLDLNTNVNKPTGSGNSPKNDIKDAFERMPYSDCLPYSGARYGRNSRNHQASPVGKLWERLSYHTGSSEKSFSSDPDLTCFTIDEDSCITEESNTIDEIVDDVQEETESLSANHCDKRQPLKETTNFSPVLPASGSVEDISTESTATAIQNKVQQGGKKQASYLGDTELRKKHTFSIGSNGVKKGKDSMNNSVRKQVLPNKSSLKMQEQKLSLKGSRMNNIVSNVNSFVPFVQQKQAAPMCAGNRDVKVKALEAADAAKRLEERRENERKIRKEALKLERAKLEEQKLRQIELDKKTKEEERKKKDADIIAKKRLREEEEKKEKEKKRMRLDGRHMQREQEEKMRAEKAEKQKQRSKDEKMNIKKKVDQSRKQQNMDVVRGADFAFIPTDVMMNREELDITCDSIVAGKAMHTVDKSPTNEDLIVQKTRGNSYEISPYQCSDDEDEENDERPTKKYIPSWASKRSISLLLTSLHGMDPDEIFPPKSCRSINEDVFRKK